MKRTFNSLVLLIIMLSFSFNVHAHSGLEHSSNMHIILHAMAGISVCFALMAIGFFLRKHLPSAIRQRK